VSKVFIGGSRKIKRLNNDIASRIDNILQNKYAILLGDATGVDKTVQKYLLDKRYNNVFVYCTGKQCRNNLAVWETKHVSDSQKTKKDFSYYSLKDLEMAKEADYGFMIWDGKSKGTLNNILNLLRFNKKTLVYYFPEKHFYTVDSFDVLKGLLRQEDQQLQAMFKKAINTLCNEQEKAQKEKQTALSFR
jgi:sRNA-binding regulator protein Hfq